MRGKSKKDRGKEKRGYKRGKSRCLRDRMKDNFDLMLMMSEKRSIEACLEDLAPTWDSKPIMTTNMENNLVMNILVMSKVLCSNSKEMKRKDRCKKDNNSL